MMYNLRNLSTINFPEIVQLLEPLLWLIYRILVNGELYLIVGKDKLLPADGAVNWRRSVQKSGSPLIMQTDLGRRREARRYTSERSLSKTAH